MKIVFKGCGQKTDRNHTNILLKTVPLCRTGRPVKEYARPPAVGQARLPVDRHGRRAGADTLE